MLCMGLSVLCLTQNKGKKSQSTGPSGKEGTGWQLEIACSYTGDGQAVGEEAEGRGSFK